MTKGRIFPREDRHFVDPRSGRRVRQVTSHASIHHHPFFFVPAYDEQMQRLVFISHRTGAPQIFFEERQSGKLVQATDRPDLAEWSIYPSPDGRYVYFVAGTSAWRVELDTLREEELANFGDVEMREKGMVGASMGTTALSHNGRWWAIPVKTGKISRFVLIDTESKSSRVFLERDTIGHPQFCPDDDDLILYAGPLTDRVWITDRSGTKTGVPISAKTACNGLPTRFGCRENAQLLSSTGRVECVCSIWKAERRTGSRIFPPGTRRRMRRPVCLRYEFPRYRLAHIFAR
jgi:oligogalacturonide lyase